MCYSYYQKLIGQNSKDDAKLILDNQEEILNNSNILENLLQDKVHEKLEGILQRMRTSLQGQPDIQIYFETTLGDFYVTRLWRREYEWLV